MATGEPGTLLGRISRNKVVGFLTGRGGHPFMCGEMSYNAGVSGVLSNFADWYQNGRNLRLLILFSLNKTDFLKSQMCPI